MTIIPTNFDLARIQPVWTGNASTTEIVVPCYNEETRLDATAFLAALDRDPTMNFVFVNDGSADGTLAMLTTLQAVRPERITVLSLARNTGKAEAVRQGLLHASTSGADFVGYWDADLATPLDAIGDFVRVMSRFADIEVVFGARRALLGHRIERTLKRRAVSRICGALARQAIRLPVSDTQCGAKLLRNTPVLAKALTEPFTAGWLFDVELFTRISALVSDRRRAFYEQPLAEWNEIAGSKVSARAILKSGLQMMRLIAASRLGIDLRGPETPVPMVRTLPRLAAPADRIAA